MRVLLLPDKRNWAYDTIAKALCKYNDDPDLELEVLSIKGNIPKVKKKYKKFDKFLVMGWQGYNLVKFLPKKITLVGLHSHHSWDEHLTSPEKNVDPPKDLIKTLLTFRGVNAVSKKLHSLFKKNGLNNVHYTPNGVDTQIFSDQGIREEGKFFVGYSGSKAHDWRKGTSKFIVPSAQRAGAKVKLAMLSSKNYVTVECMPEFYNNLHCYVCASSSEGFSLSVLEAAACGNPIITTRVGGMKELIRDGDNGFLVDRKIDKIAEKIEVLRLDKNLRISMGLRMAKDIKENWCWSLRSKEWLSFIKNT